MSQCANWLIRTTSIFLVIPLTSLPEYKITILGKESQENERREVRIYAIKENVKPTNTKKPLRKKEEAYSSLFHELFHNIFIYKQVKHQIYSVCPLSVTYI